MQTCFYQPAGTVTAFIIVTVNGGSRDVLVEFARISLAYQMKK